MTEWMDEAACKDTHPDVFFPNNGGRKNYGEARRICVSCPVRNDCLEHALSTSIKFGMYGGKTPVERAQIKRDRRKRGYGNAGIQAQRAS